MFELPFSRLRCHRSSQAAVPDRVASVRFRSKPEEIQPWSTVYPRTAKVDARMKKNKTSKTDERLLSIVAVGDQTVNTLTDLESLNQDARSFRRFTRAVFAAHAAVLKHGDTMNARFEQSAARWRVLIRIELGDISASSIARITGYSRQSVHRLLTELQAEGLVQTAPDSADQRRLRPQLTREGREVLRGMEVSFNVWASELVVSLRASRLDRSSAFLEEVVILLQKEEAAVRRKGTRPPGSISR